MSTPIILDANLNNNVMVTPKSPNSFPQDHTNTNSTNHTNNNTNTNHTKFISSYKVKYSGGAVKYMECLKNHAASIGGTATDGCGEFMAGGEEGSLEALKCSACNCHRNFHRKILNMQNATDQGDAALVGKGVHVFSNGQPDGAGNGFGFGNNHHQHHDESDQGEGVPMNLMMAAVKKRHRTKFTKEQKEKMLGFAEKANWKIQKIGDPEVKNFCQELGIKRKVLKVWMHNNKYHLAKKTNTTTTTSTTSAASA